MSGQDKRSDIQRWQDMAGKLANCLRHACDAGLRKGWVMDESDSTLLEYRKMLDEPCEEIKNE